MNSIAQGKVSIQTSPELVPSTPEWLGEVAVVSHYLTQLGLLEKIAERVRFARARSGSTTSSTLWLPFIGYSLSGELTQNVLQALASLRYPIYGPVRRNEPSDRTTPSRPQSPRSPTVEALRTLTKRIYPLGHRPRSASKSRIAGSLWRLWKVSMGMERNKPLDMTLPIQSAL
jgi:hypothetical protein